jgi:hypothetical protein
MVGPIARRVKVRYRFLGSTQGELEDTFPIAEGEKVVAEGSVRVRTGIGFRRLGDLRLTNQRLVLVSHYAVQPDRGFEFPRGSLTRVDRSGSAWTLYYRTEQGQDHLTIEEHLLLNDALRDGWSSDAPEGI